MNALGQRVDRGPVQVTQERLRLPLWLVITLWLAKTLARALWVLVRSPYLLLGLANVAVLGWAWTVDPFLPWGMVTFWAAVLMLVRVRWPDLYTRQVSTPARSGWRRLTVYRYRWQAALDTAGLTLTRGGVERLPVLVSVRCTLVRDRVRVRMLPGQTVGSWSKAAEQLAQTFGAEECRVRSVPGRPHLVDLVLTVTDPLTEPVAPVDAVGAPLNALPVGRAEDGSLYRLRLIGTHLLVVGATGAGKGSVLWSIILQLVPHVRAGLVRLWVLDPKGGMELAGGRPVFDRFCYGTDDPGAVYEEEFAQTLEDAVALMRRRRAALRGVTRQHTPTAAEPLVLVVIDELASLTAYVSDRKVKERIASALALLLSQGRAVGVCVVAALQDPRKETVPARDLFPTRVLLRVTEAEQVVLVLGRDARDKGARADLIPDSLPGVGYVAVDGVPEPVRVRFGHVTDDRIAEAVAVPREMPAPRPVTELPATWNDTVTTERTAA